MGRTYDNSNRRAAKRETRERILDEAEACIRSRPLAELTLNDVAEASGVSVQTVIRHFGGRDGLLEGVAVRLGTRVTDQRGKVVPGDLEGAIDNVLEHYEAEGTLMLRIVSEEAQSSFAADRATEGRDYHRGWVLRTFEPLLAPDENVRERQLDALLVATDLFTWRLLRLDHDRSLKHTRQVMLDLVRAALKVPE